MIELLDVYVKSSHLHPSSSHVTSEKGWFLDRNVIPGVVYYYRTGNPQLLKITYPSHVRTILSSGSQSPKFEARSIDLCMSSESEEQEEEQTRFQNAVWHS